jgi:adenosylcobyric acid synthase
MGRPVDHLDAVAFQAAKSDLQAVVLSALDGLRARFDVVVAEGAGSPAEPNLMADDLVNLGLAATAGIPAVLVGDIERGGGCSPRSTGHWLSSPTTGATPSADS